jgi:hypothetical protein
MKEGGSIGGAFLWPSRWGKRVENASYRLQTCDAQHTLVGNTTPQNTETPPKACTRVKPTLGTAQWKGTFHTRQDATYPCVRYLPRGYRSNKRSLERVAHVSIVSLARYCMRLLGLSLLVPTFGILNNHWTFTDATFPPRMAKIRVTSVAPGQLTVAHKLIPRVCNASGRFNRSLYCIEYSDSADTSTALAPEVSWSPWTYIPMVFPVYSNS